MMHEGGSSGDIYGAGGGGGGAAGQMDGGMREWLED